MFARQHYSLDCHRGAMINCKLYRTFQSSVMHRTASVTKTTHELSVVMDSIQLGQSMRSLYTLCDENIFHL